MNNQNIEGWEKEFDKKFAGGILLDLVPLNKNKIKSFIKALLIAENKKARMEGEEYAYNMANAIQKAAKGSNEMQWSTMEKAIRKEERTSLLGEIEKLKKEYKNNDDYRDYGTLHENVCHDDGYMAALEDVKWALEDVGGGK